MIKLSLFFGALLLGTNYSATSISTHRGLPYYAQRATIAEAQLVALVNAERRSHGLRELAVNPILVEVARQHSQEMHDKCYFDHASPVPELATPMKRYIKALGYVPKWACLGENLFYSNIVDAPLGHRCLVASPKHYQNMLDPRFEQIGVGAYISADGRFWVTEIFLAQED